MNLSSIIIVLQLALALLGTPNLSPSMQTVANDIANQAITLAEQALVPDHFIQATSTPVSVVIPAIPQTTITYVPQNIGSPDLGTVVPPIILPPTPACALSVSRYVTMQGTIVTVNWTSTAPVSGSLYATNNQSGGNPMNFDMIASLSGQGGTLSNLVDDAYWKAVFGDTTCTTTIQ